MSNLEITPCPVPDEAACKELMDIMRQASEQVGKAVAIPPELMKRVRAYESFSYHEAIMEIRRREYLYSRDR